LEKKLKEQESFAVISKPDFLQAKENNLPQDENSLLEKQIADLQQSLQLAQDNAKAKDDEFKILQNRILSYEDGASSINGDLIRKYQQKSEQLEKELAQNLAPTWLKCATLKTVIFLSRKLQFANFKIKFPNSMTSSKRKWNQILKI